MARQPKRKGPPPLDARGAALRALVAVDKSGAGCQDALKAELDAAPRAAARDRALTTELVYGTLRWRRRLDHALAAFAPKGLPIDDVELMTALRLAAYQLLFLDSVPPWAAVDGAVRQVKRRRGQGLARFANGLLRALARAKDEPPALPEGDGPDVLAVRYSLPSWLVQRLAANLSADALALRLEAENGAAPFSVRANTLKADATSLTAAFEEAGARCRPVADLPGALVLERPGRVFRGAALSQGRWVPQDCASQRVVAMLDAAPGQRALDMCAGAGVKTTQLAELVGPSGHVDAVDTSARRIEQLQALAVRWGTPWITAAVGDSTQALPDALPQPEEPYERILLDAPCSALGLLRRRPDVRWRRREADIHERAALQEKLLDAAVARLAPGGRLVYAVCTFTQEEGPRQIERALARHDGLRVVRPASPAVAAHLDDRGYLVTDPTRDGQDAFFAAALER